MMEVDAKIRKWGNSLGIVIPIQEAEKENIKVGEEVTALLTKKDNILRETFGKEKFSKSTEQMMKEMDEDLYPNE
tara:strand:- start:66 stop:290 length:225 start_codon:yes stop_codon:yes gene_type:complete